MSLIGQLLHKVMLSNGRTLVLWSPEWHVLLAKHKTINSLVFYMDLRTSSFRHKSSLSINTD